MVSDTVFEEQAHGEAFIQEPPNDLCKAKLEANPTTNIVSPRETLVPERSVNAAEWGWGANQEAGVGGQVGGATGWNQRPKKKVLVIDDDATMRMLLKMGLRSHEYDCLTAENGMAAQAVLRSYRPDLILVDLLMPVMDGLTFIQWLRQTACDSTPVLVFTNVSTPKITQEALTTGANAFACKPLHLKELMEVIAGLVLH